MAASAAAGTEYWLIHSRIVVSSEVATCARLSPARAAEPDIASARPQSVTPKPARFHGLAVKREAEACAGMRRSFWGTILSGPPFVPAEPCEVHCRPSPLERDEFGFAPPLNQSPIIPAKAGIQGPRTRAKELGPRFRGDERNLGAIDVTAHRAASRMTRSMPLTTRARLSTSTLSGVSVSW